MLQQDPKFSLVIEHRTPWQLNIRAQQLLFRIGGCTAVLVIQRVAHTLRLDAPLATQPRVEREQRPRALHNWAGRRYEGQPHIRIRRMRSDEKDMHPRLNITNLTLSQTITGAYMDPRKPRTPDKTLLAS